MRSILLSSLTLVLFAIASCTRTGEDPEPQPDAIFTISPSFDGVSLEPEEQQEMTIYVDIERANDPVLLSIEGLPAGVTSEFTPTSGSSSFNSLLKLNNIDATPGIYSCKLKARSGNELKQSSFQLTVKADPLCRVLGSYTYNMSQLCDPLVFGGILTTSETLTAAAVPVENALNPIRFANFGGYSGLTVTGKVNCDNNTINIPIQSVGTNMEIAGIGTFTSAGITVSYTIYENGVQTACNFTMLKVN